MNARVGVIREIADLTGASEREVQSAMLEVGESASRALVILHARIAGGSSGDGDEGASPATSDAATATSPATSPAADIGMCIGVDAQHRSSRTLRYWYGGERLCRGCRRCRRGGRCGGERRHFRPWRCSC